MCIRDSVLTEKTIQEDVKIKSAEEDNENDKSKDWNHFCNYDNSVYGNRFLDAAHDQKGKDPDQNRGADDGGHIVSIAEHRHELTQCGK